MRVKCRPTFWRKWFAWRPVRVSGYYVWAEYVERIYSVNERCYYYRNYRGTK